jgi:hypothetical protein
VICRHIRLSFWLPVFAPCGSWPSGTRARVVCWRSVHGVIIIFVGGAESCNLIPILRRFSVPLLILRAACGKQSVC